MAHLDIVPEVTYEDGVPLIPNVDPVMILQGSDYDIGYQFAVQLYEIYGPWALERLHHDFTEEELNGLKAYHKQIEEYAPEFIEIFRGRSDGAAACGIPVTFEEFELNDCRSLLSSFQTFPGEEPEGFQDVVFPQTHAQEILPEGCSGIACWGNATKDHTLICAGSADHPISHHATMVIIPESGNSYIGSLVIPQTPGMHPVMNNKGLVHVHHGQGIYGDEKPGYGLPAVIHLQHTLRFCDTAEQALEMQLSYPPGQKASGLWVDTEGGNFVLESRDPLSVRHAGDYGEEDFLYASNTQLGKDLGRFASTGVGYSLGWPTTYYEHGGWNTDDLDSVRRNFQMWNAMHNYKGHIDQSFMEMLWRMPSKAIEDDDIQASEKRFMATYGEGWDSYIGNLGNCFLAIMKPDNGDNGIYSVCLGAPGLHAQPLTTEFYFFPTDPLHVFVDITLAKDAPAVCHAMQRSNQFALYDANKALRKLTYHDVAYAPLDAQFNRAAIDTQQGEYWLAQATAAQGNEQIRLYAKSTRAFARSQALAKNISLMLDPPAEFPQDLDLQEWFGAWGQWESVDSCKPDDQTAIQE